MIFAADFYGLFADFYAIVEFSFLEKHRCFVCHISDIRRIQFDRFVIMLMRSSKIFIFIRRVAQFFFAHRLKIQKLKFFPHHTWCLGIDCSGLAPEAELLLRAYNNYCAAASSGAPDNSCSVGGIPLPTCCMYQECIRKNVTQAKTRATPIR